MTPESPTVRSVDVSEVRPLRSEVLRPGRPPEASVYPGEENPRTGHVAVSLGDAVVAVGTVFPDSAPWAPERTESWRIRGMATRDGLRGRRFGNLVIDGLLEHASSNGGRFIWCEARTTACNFYARSGFVIEGEPFMLESVLHVHMWRDL